ncbi:hypothetical protein [Streptomyces sp. SID3343]|uniref:hypothetical protein n=1 Tax=Streptomyces sp. SID3343 TaxID=2690260 RepID=UPI0013715374|nr:hypothetical protein [Streptomyces sp. SID3343]MYW03652.1 hypothetical protein [Streptomyces sp. SID3343]
MAFRPGQGTAALVAAAVVAGTVLALYFGSGVGIFESADSSTEHRAGPSIDGTFDPDPTSSSGAGPATENGGSTGATASGSSDGGSSQGGAESGGGNSAADNAGSGSETAEMDWNTRIEQPKAPSQVDGNVNPGVFAVSTPSAGQSRLTVDRTSGTAKGSLNSMLVQDFRGSLHGWTLTGAMSDFHADDGTRIEARNLIWEPHCVPHPGRGPYPSSPKPGTRVQSSSTATLCSTTSSTSVTGGEFDVGADLTLRLPDRNTSAETFSATLTLTLS